MLGSGAFSGLPAHADFLAFFDIFLHGRMSEHVQNLECWPPYKKSAASRPENTRVFNAMAFNRERSRCRVALMLPSPSGRPRPHPGSCACSWQTLPR
jgi:hypothetical protein